jgi:hypothetical protein
MQEQRESPPANWNAASGFMYAPCVKILTFCVALASPSNDTAVDTKFCFFVLGLWAYLFGDVWNEGQY